MSGLQRVLTNTFSLIALDRRNNLLGAACASRFMGVGAVVPHLVRGVGAVNTQHEHEVRLAEQALSLMATGTPPDTALAMILAGDAHPELRQLILLDVHGRKAAHTGAGCQEPRHHQIGETCVAAGNTIVGPEVVTAMVAVMDRTDDTPFALKLVNALAAAEAVGGDSRGKQAAGVRVISATGAEHLNHLWDFRVDDHADPITELRRLYELRRQSIE